MLGDDFVLSLSVAAALDSGIVVALLASSTGALCVFDSLVGMCSAHWNGAVSKADKRMVDCTCTAAL